MAGRRSLLSPPELDDYIRGHTRPPTDIEVDQHAATDELGGVSSMRIDHEQMVLMTMLTQLVGPGLAVEVGTFTGASAMAIARGLPDGGRLVCFDVSRDWTSIAERFWEDAGLADRIEVRIGPAAEGLAALPEEPAIGLAFIDADKVGYIDYHEQIVPRLRPGGLLLVDNVLWSGDVVDHSIDDESTRAIRAYNDHATADDRVEGVILPVGDGVFMLRRR